MGFYDLNNCLIYNEKSRDDVVLGELLPQNIILTFYNNCYYFLDFREAKFFKTNLVTDMKGISREDSISIYLQKEVINALNACLYIASKRTRRNAVYSDQISRGMKPSGINQFFLPNTVDGKPHSLATYLNDISCNFSTEMYRIASEKKYSLPPTCNFGIGNLNEGLGLFARVLENVSLPFNQSALYILSHLWKAVYYLDHDHRVDSVIFMRSVYELLVKRKNNLGVDDEIKEEHYGEYCNNEGLNQKIREFKDIRNSSVHNLSIPEDKQKLTVFFSELLKFFKRDFEIDIGAMKP